MEDQQIINEFLIESNENLTRLDQEMVELERRPEDAALLASIFRTIHTIKGTCGFLGFEILEGISHLAETILSQVRAKERPLTLQVVSLVLESVDAIKAVILNIEQAGGEGGNRYEDLCTRLRAAAQKSAFADGVAPPATPSPDAPAAASSQSPVQLPKPQAAAPPSREPIAQPSEPLPVQTVQNEEQAQALSSPRQPDSDAVEAASKKTKTDLENGAQKGSVADSTIRVDVGLLDRLMNLVGELVLARNQVLQYNAQQEDAGFAATSQRLNLITSELQESVMKTRMQPIGVVWNKLPRVVRDLAASCGKQISLEMDGADTELDKTIIEAIKDPLTHIVRNCCDHGIEKPEVRAGRGKSAQGRLLLRAFHEGGHVNIEVGDDGAGIDAERVKQKAVQKGLIAPEHAARMSEREAAQLIFHPGLSTAESVTSISGRGVGMDVVRTNIEKIGGVVDLLSERGHGTTVKIKIPLTLAIIPGLIVTGGGMRFVIPQVSLLELIRLEGEEGRKQVERIHGAPVYRRRGQLLPLAYLNELLQIPATNSDSDAINIVVLQAEDRQFGLVVDDISDTQEIVVKPIGKLLKGVSCYAGATIMGDGHVALILDVMGVAQRSGVTSEAHDAALAKQKELDQKRGALTTLLLFQIGGFERLAVPLSLVARLEEFPASRIESAAGELVIQYRGGILPLITFDGGNGLDKQETVQVVVFSDGDRQVGLIVDRILDIVAEHLTVKKRSAKHGILGSAVVGQHVTDFLDLEGILQSNRASWSLEDAPSRREAILVADGSAFSRSLVRSYLEMEGHSVWEAASVPEAVKYLQHQQVSLVLASPDLPGGGPQLLRSMASTAQTAAIPVVALVSTEEQAAELRRAGHPYQAFPLRTDRDAVLQSIRNLARAIEANSRADVPHLEPGTIQPAIVH